MSSFENPPGSSPSSPWAGEGLEFELTDLAEARRVLDDETVAPIDLSSTESSAHWSPRRRRTLATDRALTGRAIDWLLSMPSQQRPHHLGRQFPRIANALAEAWPEPATRRVALAKLLDDGRTGRKGFAKAVHDELLALRDSRP